MPMPKKPRANCLYCNKKVPYPSYKYCSNNCQMNYQYDLYINDWLNGKEVGLQGHGVVSQYVKRYLRKKYNNMCCLCGWSMVNTKTGLVPLVADHIDGNWQNNIESNLRLICPNCDSLTRTYAGLNRGNGRKQRSLSNRVKEGKQYLKNMPK